MMKKITVYLAGLGLALSQITTVLAADVEVKWTNPDKYTDIYAGEEHRRKFKERMFISFERHFAKLAAALPANQQLNIEVTNVDLAGDVHHGGSNRIRLVKDLYFPRMDFSYQLLNADKSVVKSEQVALKDMSFLMTRALKYRNESLRYEKQMLDHWFKKSFINEMSK